MSTIHPTSFRPSGELDARLTALASRSGMSKNALVATLADEGERMWRYPGIAFRGPDNRRRAWVIGGGGDVWEIIRTIADLHGDTVHASTEAGIPAPSIHLARAYYREFREEIDGLIAANSKLLDDWQANYPLVEVVRVDVNKK